MVVPNTSLHVCFRRFQVAYFGDVKHCSSFFSGIHLECPSNYNLADHIRKSSITLITILSIVFIQAFCSRMLCDPHRYHLELISPIRPRCFHEYLFAKVEQLQNWPTFYKLFGLYQWPSAVQIIPPTFCLVCN